MKSILPKGKLRRSLAVALMALGIALGASAAPASASAQTCITTSGGFICTSVNGSGGYVASVQTQYIKYSGAACNYSAWFFYTPPSGGAYGLGTQFRAGCGVGITWLGVNVNRSFPLGTRICGKYYTDYWQNLVGQECVGLS